MELLYTIYRKQLPVIATAVHDGHSLAEPLRAYMQLQEHERFREEDPYTAYMADLPCSRVVVETSRFQTDVNRRREKALYRKPEDAWGLNVWEPALPERMTDRLLLEYDRFYTDIDELLRWTIALFGKFVVLDIHTYNHRRESPDQVANAGENPEINVGTGHNREKWQSFGHRFVRFLSHHRIGGTFVDARENVRFQGGGFSEWINRYYGEYGCVLSLEFKKTFMDEWTGRVDLRHVRQIRALLAGCIPFLLDMLDTSTKSVYLHG